MTKYIVQYRLPHTNWITVGVTNNVLQARQVEMIIGLKGFLTRVEVIESED